MRLLLYELLHLAKRKKIETVCVSLSQWWLGVSLTKSRRSQATYQSTSTSLLRPHLLARRRSLSPNWRRRGKKFWVMTHTKNKVFLCCRESKKLINSVKFFSTNNFEPIPLLTCIMANSVSISTHVNMKKKQTFFSCFPFVPFLFL